MGNFYNSSNLNTAPKDLLLFIFPLMEVIWTEPGMSLYKNILAYSNPYDTVHHKAGREV